MKLSPSGRVETELVSPESQLKECRMPVVCQKESFGESHGISIRFNLRKPPIVDSSIEK